MKPTAQDILQRCKDIVEGNYPENGREVYQAGAIFTITYNLFSVSIQEGSGDSSFERAAFLLGMDSEPAPAPEIVLEWKTEKNPICVSSKAIFNESVRCVIEDSGEIIWAFVSVYGAGRIQMDTRAHTIEDAQKWCADTIKAIVTQNPKP